MGSSQSVCPSEKLDANASQLQKIRNEWQSANAGNERFWIDRSKSNPDVDIAFWSQIVTDYIKGNPLPINNQVIFLKWQVDDACTNMELFVPRLKWLVNEIKSCTDVEGDGEPGFIKKAKLKTLTWGVIGKRDHKSYYLLDGAAEWIEKRKSALDAIGGQANQLGAKLAEAQRAIAGTRDELDDGAQIFVQGLAKIHELDGDIGKNYKEIRNIATDMANRFNNTPLMDNTRKTNLLVQSIITNMTPVA